MNPSDSLVIETRDLSKAYKGVQALKNLNLTVKQHSIFGFLGPFLVAVAAHRRDRRLDDRLCGCDPGQV